MIPYLAVKVNKGISETCVSEGAEMAEIIKGAEVASALKERMIKVIEDEGLSPCLAIVRVGEKGSDLSYEKGVKKTCDSVGIKVAVYAFPEETSQEELEKEFIKINSDPEVNGILLFKPLPKHLDEKAFDLLIDPEKDMDCMSPANWAKLAMGKPGYRPCTAEAVMKMLESSGTEIKGANAVVIGRSQVIGKPLGLMLLEKDASVTWCHSKTKDIAERCKNADILVCAVGRAGFVGEEIAQALSPSAAAIDVGMNFADGKMCGDFSFEEVEPYVRKITPVPGGVGAVTNTVMASHVVRSAYKAAKGKDIFF